MSEVCNCSVVLGNTGLPNCVPIQDVAKRLILVPTFASDGTINEYATTTTFNQVFFDARINDADPSKRWYPTPDIENIEDVRADAIFETLNNGKNIFIQQGARTFTGIIVKGSAEFLGQLEKNGCTKFSAFVVDKNGNLIGNGVTKTGYIRPIKIDNNTWYPRLQKKTDTESQKVQLNFEWDIIEKDSNIRMISAVDISIDLFDLKGLVDVLSDGISSITTTGFTAKLKTLYGTLKAPVVVKGLVLADFDLYNKTTSSAIVITSVTETPDGTYAFVFPAQSSADVLELSIDKDGFDSTLLEATAITIP
jgi:hypothetical protein